MTENIKFNGDKDIKPNDNKVTVFNDLSDIMDVPDDYYKIEVPKLEIVKQIRNALDKNKISIRKLAKKVGLRHPQIIRVTSANNYNIDTLLKILDGLDLEIEIKPKKGK